jgi:hypothetical protein
VRGLGELEGDMRKRGVQDKGKWVGKREVDRRKGRG